MDFKALYDQFILLLPSLTAVGSLVWSLLISLKRMKQLKDSSQVEIKKIANSILSSNNEILEDNNKLRDSIRLMTKTNADLQNSLKKVNDEVEKIQAEINRQKEEAEAELARREAEAQAQAEKEQEDEIKQIYENNLC